MVNMLSPPIILPHFLIGFTQELIKIILNILTVVKVLAVWVSAGFLLCGFNFTDGAEFFGHNYYLRASDRDLLLIQDMSAFISGKEPHFLILSHSSDFLSDQ